MPGCFPVLLRAAAVAGDLSIYRFKDCAPQVDRESPNNYILCVDPGAMLYQRYYSVYVNIVTRFMQHHVPTGMLQVYTGTWYPVSHMNSRMLRSVSSTHYCCIFFSLGHDVFVTVLRDYYSNNVQTASTDSLESSAVLAYQVYQRLCGYMRPHDAASSYGIGKKQENTEILTRCIRLIKENKYEATTQLVAATGSNRKIR